MKVAINFPDGKCNLEMNIRAELKILIQKPIIKREEQVIAESLWKNYFLFI